MTNRAKGLTLLAIQLALVLSIAAKYTWERHTCPRVWTRATQYDPQQPIRGRYLALTLHASACGLPPAHPDKRRGYYFDMSADRWTVVPAAHNGILAPRIADENKPEETEDLILAHGEPCEAAVLRVPIEFFIAEHAKQPFPLAHGDELWAEVTVPPSGPPRPVRLAVSNGKDFRILDLH